MSNNLVAYSRAGDIFHYRWAARRILELIYPNSVLQKIVIEGSSEIEKSGEYVIDVSEYYDSPVGVEKINYLQLKHTTVQGNKPFTISDLKETFVGFADRFNQHKKGGIYAIDNISFTIITNRKIADSFKRNLKAIAQKGTIDTRFRETITQYTNLAINDLALFCRIIKLEDSEGDYSVQKDKLRVELAQLIAGSIDNALIDNLISLVQEKVLPGSNNEIRKEDVLKRFGITSERDLYPAPLTWKNPENIVERQQQNILKRDIGNSIYPVIVHAAGGVGKSVFGLQLVNSLPHESIGIFYDCFGAGSYRNRSGSRHRHRDALVQIANELSSKGLCNPLIIQNTTLDEDIMRKFLVLIEEAVISLKKVTPSAQLFILIDAADNAEMAANEFNQPCFVHELLREEIPNGCKLVFLCRTERISLLQPQSNVLKLELNSFTIRETNENLKKSFPDATDYDGIEFHRLTGANPRVQANALDVKNKTINELLCSLGPSGTSVEQQIELQLKNAISRTQDLLPNEYKKSIDLICLGLASLPPHIPIDILAKSADVKVEAIKSFVSDIGRSLWISGASVQFRDEPTETWFRNQFMASSKNLENYINLLEPIATHSSYVAEVLPQLYLQAGKYEKLITIALSDEYLPEDNPIDARNIRVQRLQFAFKAALKAKHLKDAAKLAMRAGEEMAGNERQLDLLKKNIDLLSLLQSKEKIQEIAFKKLLSGTWDGSENIYIASLLSGIEEYKGEARGYLRSSMSWLNVYFEELRKKKKRFKENEVTDKDIMELAYAHLNIFGVDDCANFLLRIEPKEFTFRIVEDLTRRLIDLSRFDDINDLLCNCARDPYYIVPITSELLRIGRTPDKKDLEKCLDLLSSSKSRIMRHNNSYNDRTMPAIISFIEACLHRKLCSQKILRVLRYYVPMRASRLVSDFHLSHERFIYFRALAIRQVLSNKTNIDIEEVIPNEFITKGKGSELDNAVRDFKEVLFGLIPWFLLRANIIYNNELDLLDAAHKADEASRKARSNTYRKYDVLSYEVAEIRATIMVLYCSINQNDISEFYHIFLHGSDTFRLSDKLNLLHAIYRSSQLSDLKQELESKCYDSISSLHNETPEEIAEQYISLARAVCVESVSDARAYFDEAVSAVSKFGDEIVQRWNAVVSLAERASELDEASNRLAYRFIRCAELVGESVAREKYWDRNKAIQICAKMSSGIGISALSRWRDRDVGLFENQFEGLLIELINSKKITSSVGWALTRFFSHCDSNYILSICLENELSNKTKQALLDDAVYLLQIEGTNEDSWSILKKVADKYKLDMQINFSSNISDNKDSKFHKDYNDKNNNPKQYDWNKIFEGIIIPTTEGFEELMRRLKVAKNEDEFNWPKQTFQKEVVNRLKRESVGTFIEIVLQSIHVNLNDAIYIFSQLPLEWTRRISFQRQWPQIIYRLGQRYARDLTNKYLLDYSTEKLNLDEILIEKLKSGILFGLENINELNNANSFFGFVEMVSHSLEINESIELTDYSLSRFELHIENNFGDGIWDSWLDVPNDIYKNISGFIWSALGSPRSTDRWRAAHCVRKLAELGCKETLDNLIECLEHDKVDAFGSKEFPFYNLHARQYLLIALARISLEHSDLLVKYNNVFLKYALLEPHILIQKYASEVVMNLKKAYPKTYDENILSSVQKVGKSVFDVQKINYDYMTDSYWHSVKEVDINIDYIFGWDFEKYWYEPLGHVFSVPTNQILDLAANVIVCEWGVTNSGGYNKDPRVSLWNNSSNERETWHDHGSYPQTDNFDFYLSYHAMLVVAAKLIGKMPITKTRDWYNDGWEEWLSDHILTCKDGKWLSDYRDPLPLRRPKWITEEKDDAWKTNIADADFLNCLKTRDDEKLWINVKGGWHEKQREQTETFSISSALVRKETSESLLRALATCEDPYNYKLPYYEENDMEIGCDIFVLKGWINEPSVSLGLDKADPYANEIDYPPYSLGDDIIKDLGLTATNDGKLWYCNRTKETSLICETWSSYKPERDEKSDQSGIRLKASLSFLKYLCKALDCDIILDIGINRDLYYRYNSEKREYSKSQHKIFILSENGRLKTTGADYQLG